MKYAEKLQDPRWQRKRLEVFNNANFTCELCGDIQDALHVHHRSYKTNTDPWDYPISNFACLCKYCHTVVENMKPHLIIKTFKKKSQFRNGVTVSCLFINNEVGANCIITFLLNENEFLEVSVYTIDFFNEVNNYFNG